MTKYKVELVLWKIEGEDTDEPEYEELETKVLVETVDVQIARSTYIDGTELLDQAIE